MKLIVGLGNPEADYSNTRHNMGFNVINKLAEKYEISIKRKKFQALYGTGEIEGEKVILLKPQTFMNLSGNAVKEVMSFYKIDVEDILIIYDDMDTDIGTIRIRKTGGPGTHNGMKSVVENLPSQDFARIRVGIGKPAKGDDIISYVIGDIPDEEKEKLDEGVELAEQAVEVILKENIDIAMNNFN